MVGTYGDEVRVAELGCGHRVAVTLVDLYILVSSCSEMCDEGASVQWRRDASTSRGT